MTYKKMYDELSMTVHELYGSIKIPKNKPYNQIENQNLGKAWALLEVIELIHNIEKKNK